MKLTNGEIQLVHYDIFLIKLNVYLNVRSGNTKIVLELRTFRLVPCKKYTRWMKASEFKRNKLMQRLKISSGKCMVQFRVFYILWNLEKERKLFRLRRKIKLLESTYTFKTESPPRAVLEFNVYTNSREFRYINIWHFNNCSYYIQAVGKENKLTFRQQ